MSGFFYAHPDSPTDGIQFKSIKKPNEFLQWAFSLHA